MVEKNCIKCIKCLFSVFFHSGFYQCIYKDHIYNYEIHKMAEKLKFGQKSAISRNGVMSFFLYFVVPKVMSTTILIIFCSLFGAKSRESV